MISDDLLEELYVTSIYPGHPVTLALAIIGEYDTYEAAFEKEPNTPAALGNSRIRGAGGNVYAALDLLASLRRGVPFKDAVAEADRYWARCDDNENRYPEKFAKGQEQADAYKEVLRSQRPWWKR